LEAGQFERAESLFREAAEFYQKTLEPNRQATARVLASSAEMKLEEKRFAEAEPIIREAIRAFEKSAPTEWRRYYSQAMLGSVLEQTGRRAEAAPLLESAYQALVLKKAPSRLTGG
jgi:hypothetical protein